MSELNWWKTWCAVSLLSAATAMGSAAQTFTTLVNFDGTDGAGPDYAPPVQGAGGNLYGTTQESGAYGFGSVYEVTPEGMVTTLHNFDSTDGAYPNAGLVLGADGNFYGTTVGFDGASTIFKITAAR